MKKYINPNLLIDWNLKETETDRKREHNGGYRWKSPSNLAIIKYWGKHGSQLPRNPSISMTLQAAFTETQMNYYLATGKNQLVTFSYNGKENKAFAARIIRFLDSLRPVFPFIDDFEYDMYSTNSFPHGSGIASSASAMSAVALCLCDIEREHFGTLQDDEAFYEKASYVARLGSGSAARSVYGGWTEWGTHECDPSLTDYWATQLTEIHPSFQHMKDMILITSSAEKSVSSSAGHQLMDGNVYADVRYQQAKDRIPLLLSALKTGDWGTFGKIAENEALTLHALMMSSEESYILMHPNSLAIIEIIREYRRETGHHVYFSLDAGPNIHMLYPAAIDIEVRKFVDERLEQYCQGGQIIYDQVGIGPERQESDLGIYSSFVQS